MASDADKKEDRQPPKKKAANSGDTHKVDRAGKTSGEKNKKTGRPNDRTVELPTDDELVHFDDITQVDQEGNTTGNKGKKTNSPDERAVNLPTDDEMVEFDDITQVDQE